MLSIPIQQHRAAIINHCSYPICDTYPETDSHCRKERLLFLRSPIISVSSTSLFTLNPVNCRRVTSSAHLHHLCSSEVKSRKLIALDVSSISTKGTTRGHTTSLIHGLEIGRFQPPEPKPERTNDTPMPMVERRLLRKSVSSTEDLEPVIATRKSTYTLSTFVRWQSQHIGSLEDLHSTTTNIINQTTTLVIWPDPAPQ